MKRYNTSQFLKIAGNQLHLDAWARIMDSFEPPHDFDGVRLGHDIQYYCSNPGTYSRPIIQATSSAIAVADKELLLQIGGPPHPDHAGWKALAVNQTTWETTYRDAYVASPGQTVPPPGAGNVLWTALANADIDQIVTSKAEFTAAGKPTSRLVVSCANEPGGPGSTWGQSTDGHAMHDFFAHKMTLVEAGIGDTLLGSPCINGELGVANPRGETLAFETMLATILNGGQTYKELFAFWCINIYKHLLAVFYPRRYNTKLRRARLRSEIFYKLQKVFDVFMASPFADVPAWITEFGCTAYEMGLLQLGNITPDYPEMLALINVFDECIEEFGWFITRAFYLWQNGSAGLDGAYNDHGVFSFEGVDRRLIGGGGSNILIPPQ